MLSVSVNSWSANFEKTKVVMSMFFAKKRLLIGAIKNFSKVAKLQRR